ncbi:rRNA maturation protein Nop10 [Brevibacillus sp. 1238]|jgi:hypothetical protein|uniref:Transcription initiation factor TFIIIB n=1 Tax=Brevibacillus parabrevis TaxID=54914 RepID=A0A4Y3PKH7_BREPA|nr:MULTISPECIES: transcription initiation factor TFIIIB [Brevibacillus]MDH6349106.1 rRNA maturation protein Nop10 [Brevibacillus sp. 1238]MED2257621.1 transcription initiation factor TFIIIB [Brevibacillus parabrevis]RNB93688.1 transcription initiation factor TFIIIB [Brevibacillus parabrevis]UED71345.1 transcription initiation factor TFIIIB [Brevibacillus sp. HD3.3A]GEB31639.1 hypothetical protein BPA01_12190 [Brevibacillus parabrevis]
MENPKEQCPKCGCSEIGKGKPSGDARIFPVDKFFVLGSLITYHICTGCGYVIESYVENPAKFKK